MHLTVGGVFKVCSTPVPPPSPQHDYRTWLGAITDLTTYSSLLFFIYNLTKVPVEFTIQTPRDSFLSTLSPKSGPGTVLYVLAELSTVHIPVLRR